MIAAAAAVGHRRIAACQIFIGGQWENFAPTDHSYLRGEMVNQKLYTYRAQSYFRKKRRTTCIRICPQLTLSSYRVVSNVCIHTYTLTGRVRRQQVVCGHYYLFCTARLCSGSASVYIIRGGIADVAARLTTLTFIHTQMTLSYMCSVNARTQRRLSNDLKCAYQMSATGWQRTDWSWTPTRQNFSGPVPRTVLLLLLAMDHHYSSETRPSQPAIMWASSVSPSRLTSASTSTFQTQVHRDFTGFVIFEEFIVRLTLSPQRHWYTLSSHPALMAATPCWPRRQRPLQIVFSLCWMQQLEYHKFDRSLTHLLHSQLHWLDVPQRIQFKLRVTVRRCLQGSAPQYLVDCCKPTTDVASRQRLRSATRHQLIVSRHRRTKFGHRAFSVAGPTA